MRGRRTLMCFFDVAITYIIWNLLLDQYSSISSLLVIFSLYYFISYFLFKKTIGQYLFSYSMHVTKRTDILKRELLKSLMLFFPLIFLLQNNYSGTLVLIVFVTIYFINFLYFISRNGFWWESISNTYLQQGNSPKWSFLLIILLFVLTLGVIKVRDLVSSDVDYWNKVEINTINKLTNDRYIDFLEKQKPLPAVDYIFSLFEKYDQVILCERLHPEETQWEFIYEIIQDPRFIRDVGNIFTEYGNPYYQSQLDTFLNKSYASNDQLLEETAKIMLPASGIYPVWANTNLYNFLFKLNKLNQTLNLKSKIRLHFTSIPFDWDTVGCKGLQPVLKQYDSIGAAQIIAKIEEYKSQGVKCKSLIVWNYRHAFRFPNDKNFNTVANGIFNRFPHSTANVLINTVSNWNGILYFPLQNGRWDAAFRKYNNEFVGFNLKNSPFGSDNFDLYLSNKVKRYNYEDVFTGFIFWESLENHTVSSGFPNMYNYKDTILTRAKKNAFGNSQDLEMELTFEKILENSIDNQPRISKVQYFKIILLIRFLIFFMVSFYIILVLIIILIKTLQNTSTL